MHVCAVLLELIRWQSKGSSRKCQSISCIKRLLNRVITSVPIPFLGESSEYTAFRKSRGVLYQANVGGVCRESASLE